MRDGDKILDHVELQGLSGKMGLSRSCTGWPRPMHSVSDAGLQNKVRLRAGGVDASLRQGSSRNIWAFSSHGAALSRATASESSCFLFKGAHNWRLFCRHHCIARPVPVSCLGYSQAQEEGPLQLKYSSTATHTSIVLNTGPVFAFWASSAMSWKHLQAEERANLVRKNKQAAQLLGLVT